MRRRRRHSSPPPPPDHLSLTTPCLRRRMEPPPTICHRTCSTRKLSSSFVFRGTRTCRTRSHLQNLVEQSHPVPGVPHTELQFLRHQYDIWGPNRQSLFAKDKVHLNSGVFTFLCTECHIGILCTDARVAGVLSYRSVVFQWQNW